MLILHLEEVEALCVSRQCNNLAPRSAVKSSQLSYRRPCRFWNGCATDERHAFQRQLHRDQIDQVDKMGVDETSKYFFDKKEDR